LSDGSLANVQIMDTSGQERFRAINQNYYRRADCCLLVYDITDIKSFEACKYYSEQIKERCKKNIKTVLLGNKTDLESERKVPPEKGAAFSLKNNYIFMETSCKKNENVADAFEVLIETTHREIEKNKDKIEEDRMSVVIDKKDYINTNKQKKKNDCC
jgi:small GTP-binding protein